jgi:FMN-dependent NADH-azoreductase
LVGGKKVFVASSRGGAYTATDRTYLDHQESYVRAALGFMGIIDITIIRAENTSIPELRDKSIESARKEIAEMSA